MLTVAFDTGPLHGPATGIARATAGMRRALESIDDLHLQPFVSSFRASLEPDEVRLPIPARPALELWGRVGRPRVDRWLRGASIIHGTNYVVPPSRVPRLVSVYDCWALENPRLVHANVRAAMRVLRRSIDDGAFVHASSRATADRLRRLFPTCDVTVIHLGDITATSTANHEGASVPEPLRSGVPFVLAVGTRERRKNLPTLLRSFAEVAARRSDVHLVIAGGPGDDDPAIEEVAHRLEPGTRRRLHIVGRVSDPTAHWLLGHASLLAYPSLDEGFGFPLLEAMAHRLPIVASNVGSIPEVVGSAAVLVEARDANAWAEAIIGVLSDTALADRLVTEGQLRRQDFSWDKTGRLLLDLYRRVAASGS